MREETTMRRFGWLDEAHPEKTEQWLSDMAAEGWRLIKAGSLVATFERGEPATLRFTCIPNRYRNASYTERQEFLDAYRHMGWRCVDELDPNIVFYALAETETPAGEPERVCAERATAWRKRIAMYFIGASAFAAMVVCTVVFEAQYALLRASLVMILLTLGSAVYIVLGTREFLLYRRRNLCADAETRGFRGMAIPPLLSRLARLALPILMSISFLIGQWTEPNAVQLPASLVAVRAADLSGGAAGAVAAAGDTYYLAHGILFPDQLLNYCTAEREDGGVSLNYEAYRALAPWLAGLLARDIARRTSVSFAENDIGIPEASDPDGFDRLWCFDGEGEHLLVAVKGCTVYSMFLDGGYTTDNMLRALLRKIS